MKEKLEERRVSRKARELAQTLVNSFKRYLQTCVDLGGAKVSAY